MYGGHFHHLQDTSTGQIIAQHRSKMGPCDVLRQNPYNAVSLLGHSQGVVSMWTPNLTTPVVKLLAHKVSSTSHVTHAVLCCASLAGSAPVAGTVSMPVRKSHLVHVEAALYQAVCECRAIQEKNWKKGCTCASKW